MPIPAGFPLYFDGKYHVSISFPGFPPTDKLSDISKSINGTSPSLLLVPNVEFLQKFIEGDIGIGEEILKSTFTGMFSAPDTKIDPSVFKQVAQLTKIEIPDINKYKKPPEIPGATASSPDIKKKLPTYSLPTSEIKVSTEYNLSGIKGLEKTIFKSIFETQKPYIEIAKTVVSSISKAEDIVARILPLALPVGLPINTESEKPVSNAGTGNRPKSLGFGGGLEVKNALAKLEAINRKGGETKLSPEGEPIRQNKKVTGSQSANQSNFSQDNTSTTLNLDGYTYSIISTIYSTGNFNPNIQYDYTYEYLPPEDFPIEKDQGIVLDDDGDPYKDFKPDCIIFGIYDSKGAPLDPSSKLEAFDNQGNKIQTQFAKAQWALDSPKWKFRPGQLEWPTYGTPTYRWKRYPGETTDKKTQPSSSGIAPAWELLKYGDLLAPKKNLLNGEDAIKDAPVISGFDTAETTEYRNFFTDLIEFKLATTDGLSEADKTEAREAVLPKLDVDAHLENVFLYGQAKTSLYNQLNIPNLKPEENPFPQALKKSFKPGKIYSAKAASDERLRKVFGSKMDDSSGNIWIDPESDYLTKIIRVDPTTKIKYTEPGSKEPIIAEIKAFIKNVTTIKISDNRPFNIEVTRSLNPNLIAQNPYTLLESANGITEYYLENWNFNDNDGVLANSLNTTSSTFSTYGLNNNPPVSANFNAYRVTIWGEKNTPYFDTRSYAAWKSESSTANNNNYIEVIKENDGSWSYRNFLFDIKNSDTGNGNAEAIYLLDKNKIEVTGGVELDLLYERYQTDPTYKTLVELPEQTKNGTASSQFYQVKSILPATFSTTNATQFNDLRIVFSKDLRNLLKYAETIILRRIISPKTSSYSARDLVINLKNTVTDTVTYNALKNETTVKVTNLFNSFTNPTEKIIVAGGYHWIHKIKYGIPVKDLFDKKIIRPFSGITKLEDGSIVEVNNNKITKWFYMTPLKNIITDSKILLKDGYGNGELKNPSGSFIPRTNTTGTEISITNGAYSSHILPASGYRRQLSIELAIPNSKGLWKGITSKIPIQKVVDQTFNNFQIRVSSPNNTNGAIIDPLQVFNEQLKTSKPFVNIPGTKYGFGSAESPQNIGVIERFMLTEFDTESYYIIEGVIPPIADELLSRQPSSNTSPPGAKGYYKLPDAIGAIKVFINFLVEIFSKLIPNIKKLLKLLQDPLSFITDIVSEKLGEGFPFLSPEAFDTFKSAINISKQASSGSGGLGATVATGNTASSPPIDNSQFSNTNQTNNSINSSVSGANANLKEKKSKVVSKLEKHFKPSKLNNIVYVNPENLKFKSVLDGIGTIPFELFGKDLSFGIELNMSDLPKTPLKLVFPKNIKLAKLKSDSDNSSNSKSDKSNIDNLIKDNIGKPKINVGQIVNQNKLPDGTQLNPNDYKIIDIKYSTGEYINGVDYNYIYITNEVERLLTEAEELIRNGTESDLEKAQDKLEAAEKIDPDNKLIQDKLKELKKDQSLFTKNTQPLIKFILGIVTLPIKIVGNILQFLIDFFKSLTNPIKLPAALAKFLSFEWILQYFIPPGPPLPGLLAAAGIKFKPELLISWIALSKIPNPKKLLEKMNDKISAANSATNGLINSTVGNTTATATGAAGAVSGAAGAVTGAAGAVTGAAGAVTGAAGAVTGAANAVTGAAGAVTGSISESLKNVPLPSPSTKFPWPMPYPEGENLIPDDYELADLSKFFSAPFLAKLPTYTTRQIRRTPKNPLNIFVPPVCLIEKIFNAIIDFFWSILGIEAIIKPPHIKICKSLDPKNLSPEDYVKLMNGEIPNGVKSESEISGTPPDSVTEGTESLVYEVSFEDGRKLQFLDYEELQKFMDENKEVSFDLQI